MDCKFICVYGELFGGCYPGIDSDHRPIQLGIYYFPNIHFMAFDISVIDDKEEYLNYEESI